MGEVVVQNWFTDQLMYNHPVKIFSLDQLCRLKQAEVSPLSEYKGPVVRFPHPPRMCEWGKPSPFFFFFFFNPLVKKKNHLWAALLCGLPSIAQPLFWILQNATCTCIPWTSFAWMESPFTAYLRDIEGGCVLSVWFINAHIFPLCIQYL